MTKKVNAKVQKSQNQNSKNVKIHVEGKSGKELAAKVEKAVQSAVANAAKDEKPVEKPAEVQANLPAKSSDFNLKTWYDKKLSAIDCEKCAWDLAQSLTMCEPSDKLRGHVHSNGEFLYATNGFILAILTNPVLPAGVYDPVLAGKGSAKRRTFIPVNSENGSERIAPVIVKADDPKQNRIIAQESFDFSINASLHDTIFAMQFFCAAHGYILSDAVISTIVAACQKMTFKLGEHYSIMENDVLRLIFTSTQADKEHTNKVINIIRKYKINPMVLTDPKEEKAIENAEQPKEKPAAPKFQVVKKPAEKPAKAKK